MIYAGLVCLSAYLRESQKKYDCLFELFGLGVKEGRERGQQASKERSIKTKPKRKAVVDRERRLLFFAGWPMLAVC